MKRLVLKCNLLLSEEGMHPDGVYVDRGEAKTYYYLPQLVDLLREAFVTMDNSDHSGCDEVKNLCVTIEQEN